MWDVEGGTPVGAVRRMDAAAPGLWALAVAFYVVGDLVTTGVGLSTGALVEVGPLAAPTVGRFGPLGLVAIKVGAIAVCFAVWRHVPDRGAVLVPLWLAGFGVAITGWNVSRLLLVV